MQHALGVLEFDAVRQRLAEACETPLAAAEASEILPSFDADTVWSLLDRTAQAYDLIGRATPPSLGPVRDLRAPANVAKKGGVLDGQVLYQAGEALAALRAMRQFLSPKRQDYPLLWPYAEFLPEAKRLEEQLLDSLEPGGEVKDAASPQLASLRQKKRSAGARLQERIQSYTTGPTRELLSDPIVTMRDGRYVVPVKSEHRGRIRGVVHDTSSTGQTVFVEPEDVLQLGNQLREVEAAERAEVQRILIALSGKLGAVADELSQGIESASDLDLILAKARLAYAMKATPPERLQGRRIEVQGGRHPLLDPATVVPLDLAVGEGSSVLITGPNTGGKTVAIKAVGLFVAMAQCGMLLPALSVKLGPFTQIWADIGDEQSLQQSLSTFGAHIKNIAEALRNLKAGALVLLDEAGAGTDPAEGAALAKAILQAMHQKRAAVLASTHYGELKAFAYNAPGFVNAAMEFDPKSLRPTYRLRMGAPGASHALKIAERYGIPADLVEEARAGLGEQQQDLARMMEQLEQAERRARLAQSEADKRAHTAKQSEERAARKLAEADEIRRTAAARAQEAIELALREIRLEADRLFEELKRSGADPDRQKSARQGLKDLQEAGASLARDFAPKSPKSPKGAGQPLAVGAAVQIDGYPQAGTVLELPKPGQALVQVGILKITVPTSGLTVVAKTKPVEAPRKDNLRLGRAMQASTEINLIQQRAEDAQRSLERFLDDAVLAGFDKVRIVHGKGEGILRKVVAEVLRRHRDVRSFREGEPSEGGAGVTIALLG